MPSQECIDAARSRYGISHSSCDLVSGRFPTVHEAADYLQSAIPDSEVAFDPGWVIESHDWWYIPCRWIGCAGYVIDKDTGYIQQLGSCHSLDDCLWGHEHGFKYRYADLTISQVHNATSTVETLMRMGNRARFNPVPNKHDEQGALTKFWTREELREVIGELPVTFENQSLWFAIPEFRKAYERKYFEFRVTEGSWDKEFALKPNQEASPLPRPAKKWLVPWRPIIEAATDRSVQELRNELSPDHVLFGLPVRSVGYRQDCDDVVFELLDFSGRFAVVHLTFARHPEPDVRWPQTDVYEDWLEFEERMRSDNEDWIN